MLEQHVVLVSLPEPSEVLSSPAEHVGGISDIAGPDPLLLEYLAGDLVGAGPPPTLTPCTVLWLTAKLALSPATVFCLPGFSQT